MTSSLINYISLPVNCVSEKEIRMKNLHALILENETRMKNIHALIFVYLFFARLTSRSELSAIACGMLWMA